MIERTHIVGKAATRTVFSGYRIPDLGAKFPIPPHFPALQAVTNRGFTVSAYAKARLYIHAEEPIGKCAQKLDAPQQETASEALLGEISVDFRDVKEQTGQEHKDASESSDCQCRVTAERKLELKCVAAYTADQEKERQAEQKRGAEAQNMEIAVTRGEKPQR